MRIVVVGSLALTIIVLACASVPNAGALADGSSLHPRIVAVDTSHPPKNVLVDLDQPGYVAVVLVAPGHSATLLWPPDSTTDNRLSAGTHQLSFQVPKLLVQVDSLRNPDRVQRTRRQQDSSILNPGRQRYDTSMRTRDGRMSAITPTTPTHLLLITSPRPLVYRRILDKTAGVSIPMIEMEALNAVAKAIKATIPDEPREWAGYYQRVELRRRN